MYLTMAYLLRAFGGVALSMLLAVTGVLATWVLYNFMDYLWPRNVFLVIWYSSAGVGAAVGTLIVWYEPESSRMYRIATVAGLMALGLLGSWGGYIYKTQISVETAVFTSRAISQAAMVGAAFTTSIVAAGVGIVRQMRTGWV